MIFPGPDKNNFNGGNKNAVSTLQEKTKLQKRVSSLLPEFLQLTQRQKTIRLEEITTVTCPDGSNRTTGR